MKKLWFRHAGSVSAFFSGGIRHCVCFDNHDFTPAERNDRHEVFLDQENGLIRYRATYMSQSGQIEWQAARLTQKLGGVYDVTPLAGGTSFEEAGRFSDGALACCQIVAGLRPNDYHPLQSEPEVKSVSRKRTSSVKRDRTTSADIQAVMDLFK